MEQPIYFDNINKKVVDELRSRLKSSSRISIGASSFSMYSNKTKKTSKNQINKRSKQQKIDFNKINFTALFNKLETEYKDNEKNRIPIKRSDDSGIKHIFRHKSNRGMSADDFEYGFTDTK